MVRHRFAVTSLAAVLCSGTAFCAQVLKVPSGNYPTIQSAVDAAAPGDTIYVFPNPNPYVENVKIHGKPDLRLVVARTGAAQGATEVGVGHPNPFPNPTATIDGNNSLEPCIDIYQSDRVSIHGFRLLDCGTHGVVVGESVDVRLHGNEALDVQSVGIYIVDADRTVVTGNAVNNALDLGIAFHGSTQAYIADNEVRGTAGGPAVRIQGANHCVLNNSVVFNDWQGILDEGLDSRIERNTIQSNCVVGGPPPNCHDLKLEMVSTAHVVGNLVGTLSNMGTAILQQN